MTRINIYQNNNYFDPYDLDERPVNNCIPKVDTNIKCNHIFDSDYLDLDTCQKCDMTIKDYLEELENKILKALILLKSSQGINQSQLYKIIKDSIDILS